MSDRRHVPAHTYEGEPIAEEEVRALAAEAKAGYDVDELISRRGKRGRPALGSSPATVESVRLDPALRQRLLHRADADQTTPSEIIREALRTFLEAEHEPDAERQALDAERAIRPGEGYRSGMATPNKRTVTPHPDGWSVEKPGASRASSVHPTQQQAIDAARQTLANSGGGELAIKGRDGAVRAQDTVKPGNDPRKSRG